MWLEAYAQQKGVLTDDFRGVFSLLPCEKHHTPRVGESEMAWEEKKMIMLCHPQGGRKSLLGGTKTWLYKRGRVLTYHSGLWLLKEPWSISRHMV